MSVSAPVQRTGVPHAVNISVLKLHVLTSLQVASAARTPSQTYIAAPAASWLDDFLSWISPEIPRCCRAFPRDDSYCPPPDQPPCSVNASACANCTTCFRARGLPGPALLKQGRPTLKQVHSSAHH